ncbi:hypothetical protein L1987_73024 [Smallanthus sonchifolius]|uniref:Uncharacterized protein n=1 Tax=Smallanthus sonchifolius TaxID=185202 RepID=A0ACB9AW89_9ASTR|nr:hypothetical protein L1987_73024 [Smallanthus sonchifolius]
MASFPIVPYSVVTRRPSVKLNRFVSAKDPAFKVSCDHSCFEARDIKYRPPGTQINLLNHVTFTLPEKSFGLIFGPSGTYCTKPTSGSIYIQTYSDDDKPTQPPVLLSPERVGIVFQFPERYFVADNVFDEITFGLPRQKSDLKVKELVAGRLQRTITSVQTPELLVLDEPLAGLDWKARADVVKLLKNLKKELTILVVSHDLKELTPLVDKSWRMDVGGLLTEKPLPI